jgi:hypothetical protein
MSLFFLEISVAPHSKTNTPVTELLFEIASPHSLMHIQKTRRDVNFKHLCVKFRAVTYFYNFSAVIATAD